MPVSNRIIPSGLAKGHSLADRLHHVRKLQHLTQQEMADMLEVSKRTYNHYEKGERDLKAPDVAKIVAYWNIDAHWFLLGEMPE